MPHDQNVTASLRVTASPAEQLRYFHETVAFVSEAPWTRISGLGRDVADYLHRRLTQSVKKIADGGSAHGLLLDGAGFMQADLFIHRAGGRIDLIAPRESARAASELLEKYTLMDDATFTLHEEEKISVLAGPLAERVLEKLEPDGGIIIANAKSVVPFFFIAAAGSEIALECRNAGGGVADEAALDFFRIEQGIPLFGHDTTTSTIPLDAGLYDAIDFDKGCFSGQEVLARINNLGHPARRLAGFEIEGEHEIEPGADVFAAGENVETEESNAGRITSARTLAGAGRTVALGYLQWKFRDVESGLIPTAFGPLRARITPLGPARDMSGQKRSI